MLLLQEVSKVVDAVLLANIKRMIGDGRIAPILGKNFGSTQLLVVLQSLDSF